MKNALKVLMFSLCLYFIFDPGLTDGKELSWPELRNNQLFPIQLESGDHFIFFGLADSLSITGPAVLEWNWSDGELFCSSGNHSVRVRPLEEKPSQPMTAEMLRNARSRYTDVPYIKDFLKGIDQPTDHQWATAFKAWTSEIQTLMQSKQNDYLDSGLLNPSDAARTIVSELNQHELVSPGSAVLANQEDPNSDSQNIWLHFKGVPPSESGKIIKWIIELSPTIDNKSTLPSSISRKSALQIHHAIFSLLEKSSNPLLINLSNGELIKTISGEDSK